MAAASNLHGAEVTWHSESASGTLIQLGTDAHQGLSTLEAVARLEQWGANVLDPPRRSRWWKEPLEPLTEPLVPLLFVVAGLYGLLGKLADALTILVVILAVAIVELWSEARAKRAIGALRHLSAPTARAIRDGTVLIVPSAELVPGDVVLLQPGTRVPADLRLLETVALRVDESSLTGESVPVTKEADCQLEPLAELVERRNLTFSGTLVTAGHGRGVVVATGRNTELGRIQRLVQMGRPPRTPLQVHMRQLAGWLVWVAIGLSVLTPLLGIVVAHLPFQDMLLTGLTLAFATIPEELPILITIVLGLGAYQLARQRAFLKRLQAAETLGAVSVVGTDKTGTLTENRMQVATLWIDGCESPFPPAQDGVMLRLLELGSLASDAQLQVTDGHLQWIGDPTEIALLAAAATAGLDVANLHARVAIIEEYPFDDLWRSVAVLYERHGQRWLAVKGAPESVLERCSQLLTADRITELDGSSRQCVCTEVEALTRRGLRVLALAERRIAPALSTSDGRDSLERQLTLVGLVGLADPPRPEAAGAVAALQAAGIRVIMLTGDHPVTAEAVARHTGIAADRVVLGRELAGQTAGEIGRLARSASVFARITAEQKLQLVQALQAHGDVVAVSGDGVNDAPALRAAAVGVAMGQTGTDVAREAADLVLGDDRLATIVTAVRAGRTLYANLRKAVRYYLAAKIALVSASLAAVLLHLPIPFAPVQIIVMELFMDLGASTTFVAEPPEQELMTQPPRNVSRPFIDRSMQLGMLLGGLSLAAAVLCAYGWTLQRYGLPAAQTAAFATWLLGHVVMAAHMRAEHQLLLRTHPLANRPFLGWLAGVLLVLALGLSFPFLQARLHLLSLPPLAWGVVLASALLVPSWWEPYKWIRIGLRGKGVMRSG
ncbi:MAG: cation-transporting P-type ATPase [Chloroflexi bacterium]|nr:cation-transporting P-type ATPase [Chloroflexota bacterium]